MQAAVIDSDGSPEVFELREVDPPELGQDHPLIRVQAAGVNRTDWKRKRWESW